MSRCQTTHTHTHTRKKNIRHDSNFRNTHPRAPRRACRGVRAARRRCDATPCWALGSASSQAPRMKVHCVAQTLESESSCDSRCTNRRHPCGRACMRREDPVGGRPPYQHQRRRVCKATVCGERHRLELTRRQGVEALLAAAQDVLVIQVCAPRPLIAISVRGRMHAARGLPGGNGGGYRLRNPVALPAVQRPNQLRGAVYLAASVGYVHAPPRHLRPRKAAVARALRHFSAVLASTLQPVW